MQTLVQIKNWKNTLKDYDGAEIKIRRGKEQKQCPQNTNRARFCSKSIKFWLHFTELRVDKRVMME